MTLKARILIELDGQDTYEVGTAEGETEFEFTENVIGALRSAADEMQHMQGNQLG